eukprot:TRINITY_DN17107_c2_g2_i1.p3 TRINITY_DN17107_c2_g2~~TRINITY_DN17107_c2_g2_i1.p3  ORF type:complete len:187 (-),score=1.35 TRINITY_DN17107_c2_g2_i1:886-1446(-)
MLNQNEKGYQHITFKGDYNVSISACQFYGIGLAFQQNNSYKTIIDCQFCNISKQALLFVDCSQVKMKLIQISDCESGFTTIRCSNVQMSSISVSNCMKDGFCFVLTDGVEMSSISVSSCMSRGVVFVKSNAEFNTSDVFNCGKGIVLWESSVSYDQLVHSENIIQNVEIDEMSTWTQNMDIDQISK